MTTTDDTRPDDPMEADSEQSRLQAIVRRLIASAVKIPGFRVKREDFLRRQLTQERFGEDIDVDMAIETNPIDIGVPIELLDKRADTIIRHHLLATTGASAVTGIPGGLLMAATIPADLAQFYWHSLVCAQELAYLYGWPDLFPEGELELDEETEAKLILLLGTLHGVEITNKVTSFTAAQLGRGVAKYLPRTGLAGTWHYPLIKSIASQVGVRVTRQSFGRVIGKAIPIVGAAASGGITAIAFRQMTKNLKGQLRTVAVEGPPDLEAPSDSDQSED